MSFSVFVVSFFTWLVLTWSLDWQELLVGVVASLVVSMIFRKYYRIKLKKNFLTVFLKLVFVYIPVFIWEMIKANVDVASRTLFPKGNLKPGFVRVKTDLKSDTAKLILANSITLTPGTITMDVSGDELYVHWIDVAGCDEASKKKFYGKFEKILKGVYK